MKENMKERGGARVDFNILHSHATGVGSGRCLGTEPKRTLVEMGSKNSCQPIQKFESSSVQLRCPCQELKPCWRNLHGIR